METDPLTTAAQALRYWQMRQQALAHNLANTETPGFKAERVFGRLVADSLVVPEAVTDQRAGVLRPTGGPLDVALDGVGFLVVGTEQGERWTRGGTLGVDAAGHLVDGGGRPVLGAEGPIVVPEGRIEIDEGGTVRVAGEAIDVLRLETAPAGARLLRDAAGLYVPGGQRVALEAGAVRVRQGYLESSNVNPIESMVEMIEVQRAFAAIQNSVRVLDSVMGTIANDIGRVD